MDIVNEYVQHREQCRRQADRIITHVKVGVEILAFWFFVYLSMALIAYEDTDYDKRYCAQSPRTCDEHPRPVQDRDVLSVQMH